MRDEVGVLAALIGCQWFGGVPDRPELSLDQPSAVSPGNEYHLRGTTLTITNVEVNDGAGGPGATVHVAEGEQVSVLHLDRHGSAATDWTAWGGYFFELQDTEPDKNRAVIVIRHTSK